MYNTMQPTQYDVIRGGSNLGPSEASGSAVIGITNKYKHPEHKQFCLDMATAQIPVKQYEGRFFWSGPAAEVSDIQDVLSHTKIKCVWDEMGKNKWVVYPKAYGKESVSEVRKLITYNQLPIHSRQAYSNSESYKRQFDALIEMIEVELNLRLVN